MTIWKFPLFEFERFESAFGGRLMSKMLDLKDEVAIAMPVDAHILTLQTLRGQPCLWALVDPSKPPVTRRFAVRGTGHPYKFDTSRYIGSFKTLEETATPLIFHVFEVTP